MALPAVLQRLSLPVIAAPMFIVSYKDMVIEQCRAGIVGAFPALNARPAAALDDWLSEIAERLAADRHQRPDAVQGPVAVNQIVHASNTRLEHDVRVCIDHHVPILITSLRAPPRELIDAVHGYGGIVLHDVINMRHAQKAVDAGVDGLILVAAGAGGHAGTLSPFALLTEARRAFGELPLILSGAIADGRAILGAQAMGADLAYIGTRFIATQEAHAAPDYKQALIEAHAADIVYTDHFTGIAGNYLQQSIVAAGLDPAILARGSPHGIANGNSTGTSTGTSTGNSTRGASGNAKGITSSPSPQFDETQAKAWKDIWGAGQGVGALDDLPSVAVLVNRMRDEYRAAMQTLQQRSAAIVETRSDRPFVA